MKMLRGSGAEILCVLGDFEKSVRSRGRGGGGLEYRYRTKGLIT